MVTTSNSRSSSRSRRGPRTSSGTILAPPLHVESRLQRQRQRNAVHRNPNDSSLPSRQIPHQTTASATMSDNDDEESDNGVVHNYKQTSSKEQDMIKVIAPATLEEGYTFEASVDGKTFTVTVPRNGVARGEEFYVPYPSFHSYDYTSDDDDDDDDSDGSDYNNSTHMAHHYPDQGKYNHHNDYDDNENDDDDDSSTVIGQWRTTLCSCCDVLTQSTFWIGLFCPIILVAQVMTRLELNWYGQPAQSKQQAKMTYNVVTGIIIFSLLFWSIPFVGSAVAVMFYFFMVYIGMHTRAYMRQTYQIPPSISLCGCCGGSTKKNRTPQEKGAPQQRTRSGGDNVFDDCCCMLFCSCCTTIQMARHTHNDKEYPGYCCTSTGLELDAPEIV